MRAVIPVLFVALATAGQTPASLSGVVVSETGQPVRQAVVTAAGGALAQSQSVITDDAGRFSFAALPAGRFTLSAAKPAHVTNAYGARRPGGPGTPVTIAAGQRVTDVQIVLPRGAVITGTVRDRNGEPAGGLSVAALSAKTVARITGPITLRPDTVVTDDRGVYRIFGLEPGEYIVFASQRVVGFGGMSIASPAEIDAAFQRLKQKPATPPGGSVSPTSGRGTAEANPPRRSYLYAPTFHPDTVRFADAGRVLVGVGEEHGAVDITFQAVPTATLQGTVFNTDGTPRPGVSISLELEGPSFDNSIGLRPSSTPPGADGRFTFRGVVPGTYVLTSRVGGRSPGPGMSATSPASLWARTRVEVNGDDIDGLTLTLRPALTVRGRLVLDPAAATTPPELSRLSVRLNPDIGPLPDTMSSYGGLGVVFSPVGADGSFAFPATMPGRYQIEVVLPSPASGWSVQSALLGERDVADLGIDVGDVDVTGLTVALTDRKAELSGTLRTSAGAPAEDFTVVVFSADKALWRPGSRRTKTARPGTDGRFVISDLPGGAYLIAAVADADPDDLRDPAFLEKLVAASVRVTLADGERKTQDLRIAR
jgi:uncharacterized protein (DUF2141 family)